MAAARMNVHSRSPQTGFALMLVLSLLIVAGITTLVAYARPSADTGPWARETEDVLNEARAALIGRAAADDNRPGSLPCPDGNNDGDADLLVGNECPSYVGRLPWRTLGLPDLRDASGERLWYALSRSLRDDTSAQPINSDTAAQLSVTGAVPATNVAAVIIAPGAALPGQTRDAAALNNIANYLEGDNANADNIYTTAAATSAFNDRVSVITREQLFNVVEWRVADEMRVRLEGYYKVNGYFPYANDYADASFKCTPNRLRGRIPNPDASNIPDTCSSIVSWGLGWPSYPPPAWFVANGWHLLTYYTLAPACAFPNIGCSGGGFLTVNGRGNILAVVIVGGRALGAQPRPCTLADQCIEQPSAGADTYNRAAVSTSYNDKVAIIQ